MSVTASIEARLRWETPGRFWRSLDELAGSDGFRRDLEREFPDLAARFNPRADRRTALKLLGMSLIMGGLAACRQPEGIAPYVNQPEGSVPGRARYYATSLPLEGYGIGVLAESHEGRPTKIEGNPAHPASLGGTDAIMQASVFSLYDPDRSRLVLDHGQPSTWGAFQAEMAALRETYGAAAGDGIGIVIGPETSPTLARQFRHLRAAWPNLRLYRHAPLEKPAVEATRPVYRFDRADVVVALGSDFLGEGPGKLAYARQFIAGRRVRRERRGMNRLYAIESLPTLTGAAADRKRIVRPRDMDAAVAEVVTAIEHGAPTEGGLVADIATDVQRPGARPLFVAGPRESAFVHAAADRLNRHVGAPGDRLHRIASPEVAPEGIGSLADLVADSGAGRLTALFVLGVDVVHTAPGDLDARAALRRIDRVYHLGAFLDATATVAHWHVPMAHPLESWSDVRAYDGTASLLQPLLAPLYQGRTSHEVLAALAGDFTTSARDLVRNTWSVLDETAWDEGLKSGIVAGTVAPPLPPGPLPALPAAEPQAAGGLEVVLAPDPYFRDGANANNLFLAELPRPLSKLVWSNAAELAPATAAALQLAEGDEIEVAADGRSIVLPVFIHPGMPPDTVAVALGFGRMLAGGDPVGTDAFPLRHAGQDWRLTDVSIRKTGGRGAVVSTQLHHTMEGRDIVRELPIGEYPPLPADAERASLYPPRDDPDEAWGMSIDLTSCIGCMACVAACHAENNSPVVGAAEMARGHDMHWLRVDRYYAGDPAAPSTLFQPVPCMHCEDAPCEVVCPVNATVHTHDGLNAQVYNRCVGTRYCSQNCPYKVRRFNFSDYQDFTEDKPLSLLMNPDVSVRSRGVMEKCTYCVQRISEARIDAGITDTPIADGAIQTACQQACPTRAITFGNIRDTGSAVAREKAEPHSYALLAELNTKPRTTYLARLRNAPDSDEAGDE